MKAFSSVKHKTAARVCVLLLPFALTAAALALSPLLIGLGEKMPPCFIHEFTGFYCPGCGLTRSCLALLHGDVLSSLRFHPLPLIAAAICVLLYAELLLYAFGKKARLLPRSPVLWSVAAALFVVFLCIRNFIPALMPK